MVAGRLWAAWTEFQVTDRKRHRGTERLRAAPLDLDAGTLGTITELRSGTFSGGRDRVTVLDLQGQPYAQTVRYGKTSDTLVLTPLPPA